MRRALLILFCIAALVLLARAGRTPLQRLCTIVRLWREEMQPPLLVPVRGVSRFALADSWGAARSGGRRHEGIDIFARCGRPVVSATEGIVFSVGENNLGGQIVWVLGPGGYFHYYAHLGRFADIARWDHLKPGDVVGYVGNTGNAAGTSCHLHYGVYRQGLAYNPYPLLVPK